MNTQSDALSGNVDARRVAPALRSATYPMYWLLRRELSENRWIYIGQLTIATLFLFGFLISAIHLPAEVRGLSASDPAKYFETISMPYNIAAGAMMAALILMSLFYSAEALHGERRDRSILFWKSLPVSDLTTVLVKASVPLIVLPLLTFAVTVAMQLIMLLVSSVVLAMNGMSPEILWQQLSIVQVWGQLLYHLITAHALWPFPVFCWLLLVSGWARRAILLWAALPVLAIGALEKLVFNTSYFLGTVGTRIIGGGAPTDITPGDFPFGPMTHLTPHRFLSATGLWIGLALATVFLAAAVRLRRRQGPI